jgi:hypothetical protein
MYTNLMNMKTHLLLILITITNFSFGQNNDIFKVSADKPTIDSEITNDTIGKFYIVSEIGQIMDDRGQVYKIKTVELNITNGFLLCRLITEENIYYELKKPIFLLTFNKYAKNAKLVRNPETDSSEIQLTNLIAYRTKLNNKKYYPSNVDLVLSQNERLKFVTLNYDFNSFLNINVYSDVLSLFGKESNGLVQTEISPIFVYNNYPVGRIFYIFNYIQPYIKLSKFDSKFVNQTVLDSVEPLKIDRTKFNQLAYIDLGLKFNVFKIIHLDNSFDIINFGIDYKYSDLAIGKTQIVKSVNSLGFSVETRGEIRFKESWGFRYSLQGYLQQIKTSGIAENNLWDPYLIAEFSAYYQDKKQNRIFVRFKNFASSQFELNQYNTFQLGYSAKLNIK